MKNRFLLFLVFIFSAHSLWAQPTIGDCLGAIPVCNQIYTETQSPVGPGSFQEINGDFNCMITELNSVWYSFTVNQSGDFGFLLTPNDLDDDYDWALFNITNASCDDLFNDPSLIVSCNAAGGTGCHGPTGANGETEFSNQGFGCFNFPPGLNGGFSPLNALVPVEAGNTYVLCVSNWTGSPNGYTLDFGISEDIGIFDDVDPILESLQEPSDCNDNTIEILFSEPIQCSTISPSNFLLTGPGSDVNVIAIESPSCDAGGNFSSSFTLVLATPLVGLEEYTVIFTPSTQFEVLDLCGNSSEPNDFSFTTSFTVTELSIDLGNDTTLCNGQSFTLEVDEPGTVITWPDGSNGNTFEVNTPGSYTVEVIGDCSFARDTINIDFTTPVSATINSGTICEGEVVVWDVTTPDATYEWQDGSTEPIFTATAAGDYFVIISTLCEAIELTATITEVDPLPTSFFGMDTTLCDGNTIDFSFNFPGATYLWQDGATSGDYSVSQTGDYAISVTNSCGTSTDEFSAEFISGINAQIDSGTICEGDTLIWDVTTPLATYLWQDGSTSPTFMVTGAGDYGVTITNPCETIELAASIGIVNQLPEDLLPGDSTLCPNESLFFSYDFPGSSFLWQDGSTDSIYTIDTTGFYSLQVSNSCGLVTDSMAVEFIPPIILDLVTDTFLCPNEWYPIDAFSPSATFYQWQDNSNDTLYIAVGPGNYSVTAGNKCESVKVDINISECEICDVYVPNVFSPNDDGFNDRFEPLSDCLLEAFSIQVFDRWGALIFESTDPTFGWDGEIDNQKVNQGVFLWTMSYIVIENNIPRQVNRSGDITVIY